MTIILCTPIQLVPESYPALKHFIPFIQTQGTCDDEILAWNTGYPYGTYLDTRDVLHFYTGRTVRLGTCEELKALTEKTKWLLGPKADLEACLSSQQLKHFASGFRYGSLVLLSSYSITEKPIDLSPLATVHQAVTDCKAPAWPKNRYQ